MMSPNQLNSIAFLSCHRRRPGAPSGMHRWSIAENQRSNFTLVTGTAQNEACGAPSAGVLRFCDTVEACDLHMTSHRAPLMPSAPALLTRLAPPSPSPSSASALQSVEQSKGQAHQYHKHTCTRSPTELMSSSSLVVLVFRDT